ncbi:Phytoene dehydrogenase-related protein [Actinopolymorpha cephalotaxi]|uniref:Phytoene dehydrogenase-related protein n=1 Tax=Actinopolymorpha cephalotaxi TaxID=504797 RepID=A0A1I2WAX2_9ACTN|nr:FAD-dependent oxidoreductase [Actinopolymorpha cephalotaxi]NYH82666.1 UDP-galactopyranose mutase [Actinopolymorpha cephalotaxi]SFG98485.1 Phytoene dehydrogenase-related protein [Actinopolymorpha cephalotaxi]
MAQVVVVVGGGLGGLAAAARLAKLGHEVCLCEATDRLGGAVAGVEHGGFRWDLGPATMTLPATVRDLFRKSGRPLERVRTLLPVSTPRRHVFADGTALDLPVESRSGQRDALEAVLGPAAATAWETTVDDLTPVWEVLRTRALEVPFTGGRSLGAAGLRTLGYGRSLRGFTRARLAEPRLRQVLEYAALPDGGVPASRAPALTAVAAYVERTFGSWYFPGGFTELVTALRDRLAERGVRVRLGAEVVAVTTDPNAAGDARGAVTGVRLADGETLPARVVVADVDVRTLTDRMLERPPGTLRRGARSLRVPPPRSRLLVGVRADAGPVLPFETVLHPAPGEGGAPIVVRAAADEGAAPEGHQAVSVHAAGEVTREGVPDLLDLLAERGLDLRDRVVTRVESPVPAYGPTWRGAWRGLGVPANRTGVGGLFVVGGTAHPGPGVPLVLLGAATVAQEIGRA